MSGPHIWEMAVHLAVAGDVFDGTLYCAVGGRVVRWPWVIFQCQGALQFVWL